MRDTRLVLDDRTPDDFARGVHAVCGVMMVLLGVGMAGLGVLGLSAAPMASPAIFLGASVLLGVAALAGGARLVYRAFTGSVRS